MKNKPQIKEVIVVEGKSDTNKLKTIFNVETIETNGSAIDKKTLNLIKKTNLNRGVILFLDPDGMGEKIRKMVENELKTMSYQQAFIKFDVAKKKSGIAEASKEEIIAALKHTLTFNSTNNSLTWNEFLEFNIDNKNKRNNICQHLGISYCNNKQLFKRLNMLGINNQQLKSIIK